MNLKEKRWQVFWLTWLSYASYYLTRKNFSIVKSRLHDDLGVSVGSLAAVDTVYLSLYAMGQFISGPLGDRLGARRMLAMGMLGCGIFAICFGASASPVWFVLLFGLQGFFQSTGWPNNVKAVGPWFDEHVRGKVMGLWSTNYQVGGVVASAFAAFLLARYGWRSTFFLPGMLVIGLALFIWFLLPADKIQKASTEQSPKDDIVSLRPNIWRNPHVWILGLAYFCLKLIRYSLLFWLPFYFHRQLGLAEESSGYLSIVLEVGGVLGAIATGFLADRYFVVDRTRIVAPLLFGLALSLFFYQMLGLSHLWANALGLSAIGFFIYGPDTLISGACAQDIGGVHQTASVAGAINGLGSLGAVFQGIVTAYVSETWGWEVLFAVFTMLAFVSAILVGISFSASGRRRKLMAA